MRLFEPPEPSSSDDDGLAESSLEQAASSNGDAPTALSLATAFTVLEPWVSRLGFGLTPVEPGLVGGTLSTTPADITDSTGNP
ncbi:MAG: hypothetical protein WDO69_15535 [Pseudomonadota bacterium]